VTYHRCGVRASRAAPVSRAAAGLFRAAAVALLLWLPAAAVAQESAPSEVASTATSGVITTRVLGKAPVNPTVYVAPYDDTELNLKLKADFESQIALAGKGIPATTEQGAGYLLLFEAEVMTADQAAREPSLGSATADQDGAEVQVNVWSTTQDSVIGGRQAGPEPGSSVFHINAVLREQKSGEVLWHGDAYHVLKEPETERVARGLVFPLVENMGETVARAPIEIQ